MIGTRCASGTAAKKPAFDAIVANPPLLCGDAKGGALFAAHSCWEKGGVTAETATGVWACDFTGAARVLFCTGDTINGKKLAQFTLLKVSFGKKACGAFPARRACVGGLLAISIFAQHHENRPHLPSTRQPRFCAERAGEL